MDVSKTRILLVDDDKSLVKTLQAYCNNNYPDFELTVSSTTKKALKLLKSVSFDVLISDNNPNKIACIDLLSTVRNSGSNTPFIVFTDQDSVELAIQALNSGGNYYLRKTTDPERQFPKLFDFVEKALAKKQAEDALLASEKQFRHIADKASDFIWTMDLDFKFDYISPFIEQYLGYSPEELRDKSLQKLLTPRSFKLAILSFEDEMRIEQMPDRDIYRTRSFELEIIHKKGTIVWGETNFSFLRDDAGNVIGILGVTRDVTNRKQIDQQVKNQQQLLLKQRNELDLFAGTIAHDLKGQLQKISLFNEMDDHPNRVKIAKKIDEITLFISNLFLYAKRGEFLGEETDVDLQFLIEDLVGKDQAFPARQDITAKGLPTIKGDSLRLNQLFDNLLRNIVVHSGATKVEISATQSTNEHQIIIQDNGKGISLDGFERIIRTLTTKEYSSFGLLIVSKIVQVYNGHFVIESELGKGTKIILILPKVTD